MEVFQKHLNVTTTAKMKTEMKIFQARLQRNLDRYVLDHTLKLQSTMKYLKQEVKT